MPNPTPLNPDALNKAKDAFDEAMGINLDNHREPWYMQAPVEYRNIGVEPAVSTYLAVAQPVVNSVEELDALPVGSVVRGGEYDLVGEKIRHSPYPPHWCTIGEEVEAYERDLLPARVLYIPEVNDV
ncbi:hypothetical protein AOZ07_02860 [Glutamicibacter halophytocola]|uniref:hypothetical protein n=1 Tax=Glutamicibacter halophytocola TaxID=1933880 RepID=UPI0006D4B5AE|nr:hypothetical protein [Glutamicibacter halophytocola]ALG28041.1 hypothetical protein AOZ07_02860 [Glutamicibacter halophytocola]